MRVSSSAYFITLTYDDKKVPLEEVLPEVFLPVVHKRDVQLFLKRLRKASQGKIKYYLVSEYGSDTHRPHYHAIMFNVHENSLKATSMILEAWQNGFVKLGTVTDASIHYVTKYSITKNDYPEDAVKPFALISKGMGLSYVNRCQSYHDGIIDRFYTRSESGHLGPLPRYYAERLYSKAEREQNAANRLKTRKSPEEKYKGIENPFKREADVKQYFASETIKKTKSKII